MASIETYNIEVDPRKPAFHLHGICDLQIGSSSCSLTTIKRRIKEILEDPIPGGIVIPGDIEDEDRPSTRATRKATFADRSEVVWRDAEKHRAWLDKEVIPLFVPLHRDTAYGIMGVLAGHHWTQLSPVLNSVQYICMEVTRLAKRPDKKAVVYMGQMFGYMDLRFMYANSAVRMLVHVQHGEGGGQTVGASLTKIDRTAQGFEGDVFIRGHDCQLVATKKPKLYPKQARAGAEPEIMERTQVFLNLGSATRGYEMGTGEPSYIEQKMMRPTSMGWGTVKFQFRRASADEDANKNVRCDFKVEI